LTALTRPQAFNGKQGVRLKRYLMALGAYAVCVGLLGIAHWLGLIPARPAIIAALAMLVTNAVMFALIHTGINERFADPSLTWVQVICAIAVIMYVAYYSDHDRAVPLMVSLLVLSFGAFRFSMREFLLASGIVLAGYAAVINLLFWHKPESVNVYLEGFTWLTMAAVLPCYAFVGGRLSELRQRLRRTNEELSEALQMIQKMATHDTLTSLPNRALFNETLAHAMAQAARHKRSLALFLMDIDRFKNINDTLGHGTGDKVLQEAARRLTAAVRTSDMVARLGGDEFVLLVEDYAAHDDLVDIATKVLAAFAPTFSIEGQELALSVSVGVCTYPSGGEDAQQMLASADIAMYRAKELGRNRHCFYSDDLNDLSEERLALEAGLRHALLRGEIEVFYQPKVDFSSGRVNGVEALIRWRHPQKGLLMPDRFVPLAEEIGAIIPIGYWTLRRVCERARQWQELGMPLAVAVNLSASQFHEPQLVTELASILKATGVPPSFLELEITESMVMRDPDRAVEIMQALRRMGVRISIDDFGTGHSSLGYLKRFPVDCLKVDRSFVRDLPHNGDDVAITRAVIAMAHSLRMSVVAEGVEHQEQFELLRAEGCDEFQGYFCARPMEEGDLLKFVASRQPPTSAARMATMKSRV
jgi:diguanylate cyclase (GGDEF)-like protein